MNLSETTQRQIRRILRHDVSYAARTLRPEKPEVIAFALEVESAKTSPRKRLLAKLRGLLNPQQTIK